MQEIEYHPDRVPGLSECPSCCCELNGVAIEGEKPLQVITQECPECGFNTELAYLHYPGHVGPDFVGSVERDVLEFDSECCSAMEGTERATVVIKPWERQVSIACASCRRSHHEACLEDAVLSSTS